MNILAQHNMTTWANMTSFIKREQMSQTICLKIIYMPLNVY